MRLLNPPRSPLIRGEVKTALLASEVRNSPSPDKGRAGEGFTGPDGSESDGEGFSSRGTFLPYRSNLRELARQNRKNPTSAEFRIWNLVLRNKQLAQYKFTRQKPLGSFIVDFYSSALRLVIEIDGESHAEQIEYDRLRTRHLNSLGLRVIRFTNQEVMQNIEGVFIRLQELVE